MALLYQDDFQSYAVGDPPPYGDLVFLGGVVPASIIADPLGLFGQTKSLSLAANETLLILH